jgi:hypothetical protein
MYVAARNEGGYTDFILAEYPGFYRAKDSSGKSVILTQDLKPVTYPAGYRTLESIMYIAV